MIINSKLKITGPNPKYKKYTIPETKMPDGGWYQGATDMDLLSNYLLPEIASIVNDYLQWKDEYNKVVKQLTEPVSYCIPLIYLSDFFDNFPISCRINSVEFNDPNEWKVKEKKDSVCKNIVSKASSEKNLVKHYKNYKKEYFNKLNKRQIQKINKFHFKFKK